MATLLDQAATEPIPGSDSATATSWSARLAGNTVSEFAMRT